MTFTFVKKFFDQFERFFYQISPFYPSSIIHFLFQQILPLPARVTQKKKEKNSPLN